MTGSGTYDVVVIGGGIAGASAAAELAAGLRVALVEAEAQPGYHATGRSAAILAQTYGPAVIRALTQASAGFFDAPPEGFAEAPLLTPRGLARIAMPDAIDVVRAEFDEAADPRLEWMSPEALEARIPLLRPGLIAGGFLNAAAQDIDVHALLTGYLRLLRQRGGAVVTGTRVDRLERDGTGWRVGIGGKTLHAGIVVNAAGAWADTVAGLAGLKPLGLVPRRRSAITFDAPAGLDAGGVPMVVGDDEEYYMKPEGGRLMASPADEAPSPPCDARPEELDIAICVDRITRVFDVEVRRIRSSWAGLRTFAGDGVPVCGFDPDAGSFFWLAGQGGYGVQTAPALARLTAALVRQEAPGPGIIPGPPVVKALAPGRPFLRATQGEGRAAAG